MKQLAIDSVTYLRFLYLYPRKKVTDITGIEAFRNLKSLNFTGRSLITGRSKVGTLSDISPLSKLTNLEYLSLYQNRIEDISPIQNLTKLKI